MFRRRPRASAAHPPAPEGAPPGPTAAELAERGWVLPAGIADADGPPAWTLVGTVGSPVATPVDPAGLVVGEGWSLDWWIGADDRWHLPAVEPAVRQELLGDAPVCETRVRIPGGDAVQRVYGIRSPRAVGDEWVVVEIENQTPVPLGVAVVVRPLVADGLGAIEAITSEPVDGGVGRDQAQLVRVDGRATVVAPRTPAAVAVGNRAEGDVVDVVTGAQATPGDVAAACPDGLATAALVFPLAHTATLRLAIPVGEADPTATLAFPAVVPDAETVAAGWEIHRRSPRIDVPDARLQAVAERSRAQLLLAHDGSAVRRDGHRAPDLDPGVTEVLLGALDVLDRPADVGSVVARWVDRVVDPDPATDAMVLSAVSHHWLVHRVDALRDWMMPELAAAVERLDRADRKGRLGSPSDRIRARRALQRAARVLAASDQPDAAAAVTDLAERIQVADAPADQRPLDELVHAGRLLAVGDRTGLDVLDQATAQASATGCWPWDGEGGRPLGDDLAMAAAAVLAVRSLLVAERPDGLALLPVFPERWYGAGIEVHEAPTELGRLSYAIRWHGTRPALLWELEPHEGVGPVRVQVPGLDPTWSTTEARGDALLAEVKPPEGVELFREVAEHPDIDPAMRRPGDGGGDTPGELPEGGTFS